MKKFIFVVLVTLLLVTVTSCCDNTTEPKVSKPKTQLLNVIWVADMSDDGPGERYLFDVLQVKGHTAKYEDFKPEVLAECDKITLSIPIEEQPKRQGIITATYTIDNKEYTLEYQKNSIIYNGIPKSN